MVCSVNKARKQTAENCMFARKIFPRFETYPNLLYTMRLSYDIFKLKHKITGFFDKACVFAPLLNVAVSKI